MSYKKFSLLLILFLSACATSGAGRFRNFYEEDIASNRESIRHGSPTQAIGDLSMILELDKKNAEARFLRALAYQKNENYAKAIEDYDAVLKMNPDHAKAHYNLAMIYAYKIQKGNEALKHFDNFITLKPADPKSAHVAKIMLSLDFASRSNDPANLNEIIRGVLVDQGIIRAQGESGAQGKRKALAEAIRSSPGSAGLNFAMAKSFEQDGKTSEAIKYYNAALEIRPTYAQCHENLAQLLNRLGKTEEAEMHMMKADLFRTGVSNPPSSGGAAL